MARRPASPPPPGLLKRGLTRAVHIPPKGAPTAAHMSLGKRLWLIYQDSLRARFLQPSEPTPRQPATGQAQGARND